MVILAIFGRSFAFGFMVCLGLIVIEQSLSRLHCLVYSLLVVLSLLIFAKKLFAHEKHSYAETVPGYILMMSVTGAYLLAILNGIAA